MSRKPPDPPKICDNCGAGHSDPESVWCVLCGEPKVRWVNLAAGLRYLSDVLEEEGIVANGGELLRAAADTLMAQQDTIKSLTATAAREARKVEAAAYEKGYEQGMQSASWAR
jgi:hypothetical protein